MTESPDDNRRNGEPQKGEPKGPEPELFGRERQEVRRRTTVRAHVVHEAIRAEGEDELRRAPMALAWSGLAAGLSMGFSMTTEGLLAANLPDAPWTAVISNLGYSVGFLIVVMGRQQLFTENTLTVVLPLLRYRDVGTLRLVARLWAVVLAANLVGAFIFALGAHVTDAFSPETMQSFADIGRESMHDGFFPTAARAIVAGWLIALMVWLMPSAESARLWIVIIITYVVALGNFAHIIAGSVETFLLVILGDISVYRYLVGFMAPTLLGNIVGGVAMVSALNHAQVISGEDRGSRQKAHVNRDEQ